MVKDDAYLSRLVDEEELHSYLEGRLGTVDAYDVERLSEGHSNETLVVTWGDHDLILRRPPPGETADTAHDVSREYRVMDALQTTDVAVPTTVAYCEDDTVIGSDFFLMERVAGSVIRETEPEPIANPESRRVVGRELVDTLADIHAVNYEAVGLEDFGHPAGFTARQVDRWQQQIGWATERTADERTVPLLDDIGKWLAENVPSKYPFTLVHGDYKLDNVVMNATSDPTLLAVLDWELSTLGDPFTDLGWLLSTWRDPVDPEPVVPEILPTFTDREGYPSRQSLVDRYESRAGLEFRNQRFYRTLAIYKLAALCEMFYRRYLEGNSDDPAYPAMKHRVPELAQYAVDIIDEQVPM